MPTPTDPHTPDAHIPDSQIPDSQITDAFIDHAGDFRAMRTALKLNSLQMLAALQRPTVQAFIESVGSYLDATRATRDAIERANLAEALRPSLDHVLDPVLRCRIVSTLIRAAGAPRSRSQNSASQAAAPHRHADPFAERNASAEPDHTTSTTPAATPVAPAAELAAITPTTQRTPPRAPTPPITHPRQPFLNRAARRAANQAAKHLAHQAASQLTNQAASQPPQQEPTQESPQQIKNSIQPLHPRPTRHAA